MLRTRTVCPPLRLVALLGPVCLLASVGRAQIWDGGGADNNWTNGLNWVGDVAPAGNGTVGIVMAGITRLTPNVNAPQDIISLTFSNTAGAFVIGNNPLTIRNSGITNNSTNLESLTCPITLFGGQTWNAVAGPMSMGAVTLGGSPLIIDGAFNTTITGIITSTTSTITKNGAGTLTFGGNNTWATTLTINGGTATISANDRLANALDVVVNSLGVLDLNGFNETIDALSGSGSVTLGAGTLSIGGANASSTFAGVISGANGSINKVGTGTLTLTGTSTYGATSINGGVLRLGVTDALPADAVMAISAGSLDLNGFSAAVGSLAGGGNVINSLGAGTLTAGSNNVNSTYSGVMSGNTALVKTGTGALTLSGSNTYTGSTTVQVGTLRMGALNALPTDTALAGLTGATLDLNGFATTIGSMSGSLGVTLGAGTLTVGNTTSSTYSGSISGSGGLSKQGSGTLTLTSTSSTYTGATTLLGGVLAIGSEANLPPAAALILSGGTLRTTSSCTLAGPLSLVATGGTIDTAGTTTLTGPISGTGGLTKVGLGTLALNTFSASLAALTVNAGDFVLPAGGNLSITGPATFGAGGFTTLDGGMITAGSFVNSGEIDLRNDARLNGPVTNSGILAGDGRVTGALTNTAAGDIRVQGGVLHFAGPSAHSNAGVLEVIGGELEFDAAVTNIASTGLIYARDAVLRFNGGLVNQGSAAMSFGTSDIFGDITNGAGASIVISGGSDATFVDDLANSGSVRTSAGSSAVFLGGVSGSGSFPGAGTVFLEGDLRPGNSPARVDFGGDLVLGAGSLFVAELAGLSPGSQYDQVAVAGHAFLDGTLRVTPLDGFTLAPRQTFTVVTGAPVTGTFAQVDTSAVPSSVRVSVVYSPTSVTLVVTCSADFNGDGDIGTDVDIESFFACLAGSCCPACAGPDYNGDGDVGTDADIEAFFRVLAGGAC